MNIHNSAGAKPARRILGEGPSIYHVVSRVVDRRMIFESEDKEFFRKQMRILEEFTGVEVITYCFMSNHFHLLLRVPDKEKQDPLDEKRLRAFLPKIHGPASVRAAKEELDRAASEGDTGRIRKILARYEKRRGNLAAYMKSLKQRMTLRMNQRLDRVGTIWEGRYKSLLVGGGDASMATVAGYIDLNPVRAGMVERPEEYRWSGYAEAENGKGKGQNLARDGLVRAVEAALGGAGAGGLSWEKARANYRCYLAAKAGGRKGKRKVGGGRSADKTGRVGAREEEGAGEARAGAEGKPGFADVAEALGQRVRYFIDGGVLGSAEFVEEVFEREKASGRFGKKRTSGARRMQGAQWGGLRVLRNLKERLAG